MSQLASFLLDVSKDSLLLLDFRRDPDRVMERARLSWADREAVKSGDADRIRGAMGGVTGPESIVVVAVVLAS